MNLSWTIAELGLASFKWKIMSCILVNESPKKRHFIVSKLP